MQTEAAVGRAYREPARQAFRPNRVVKQEVNTHEDNHMPHGVGLKLIRAPRAGEVPVTARIRNVVWRIISGWFSILSDEQNRRIPFRLPDKSCCGLCVRISTEAGVLSWFSPSYLPEKKIH